MTGVRGEIEGVGKGGGGEVQGGDIFYCVYWFRYNFDYYGSIIRFRSHQLSYDAIPSRTSLRVGYELRVGT